MVKAEVTENGELEKGSTEGIGFVLFACQGIRDKQVQRDFLFHIRKNCVFPFNIGVYNYESNECLL